MLRVESHNMTTNTTNLDDDDVELLPLTEAKRAAAFAFEHRYLLRVMKISRGSVSEGARRANLDRTNFRRLLKRHGIDADEFKRAAAEADVRAAIVAKAQLEARAKLDAIAMTVPLHVMTTNMVRLLGSS